MNYSSLRQQAYEANMQLPQLGLVLFTFGNVSVADRAQGVFAIKPSGVPYNELSPGKIVIVDFDNKVVDGSFRPSSDTATHAFLYKTWEAAGSIVHTHSTYATSWSQALRDIPLYGTTHADHCTHDIPCTEPLSDEMIKGDYELETGRLIVQHFKERGLDPREVQMVLVGNHAPFTWGDTAAKAVYHAAVLEQIAQMAWITEQVNPQIGRLKPSLVQKHFERKHGPNSYYGQ